MRGCLSVTKFSALTRLENLDRANKKPDPPVSTDTGLHVTMKLPDIYFHCLQLSTSATTRVRLGPTQ